VSSCKYFCSIPAKLVLILFGCIYRALELHVQNHAVLCKLGTIQLHVQPPTKFCENQSSGSKAQRGH
jgi:hypothetical protein